MPTTYFKIPQGYIARNPGVASMSTAQAIAKTYYKTELDNFDEVSTEPEETRYPPELFFGIVEQDENPPEGAEIFQLFREPLEWFLALCGKFKLSVAEGLVSDHPYFQSQLRFRATKVFAFPKQLKEFQTATGLTNFPKVNVGEANVAITPEEKLEVLIKYKLDFDFYKGL